MVKASIWYMICGLLLVGAVLAACLLLLRAHGYELLTVQSNSMLPQFRKGDAVIVRTSANSLQPGDIIAFHNRQQSTVIVSHRLVKQDLTSGQLTTKGDALQANDAPIPKSVVVGKVAAVLPAFGYVQDFLRNRYGLLVFLYIPAGLIVGTEAHRVSITLTAKLYMLHGYRVGSRRII